MANKEEDTMDLDKALHKTVAKMIKEKVDIKKTDIRQMVKDSVKTEIKRIIDTFCDSVRPMVEDMIREELENKNITLVPKEDPCPPNAFNGWTPSEDLRLKDALQLFIHQQASKHGRSYHAIFCRMRDKSFTKQEI